MIFTTKHPKNSDGITSNRIIKIKHRRDTHIVQKSTKMSTLPRSLKSANKTITRPLQQLPNINPNKGTFSTRPRIRKLTSAGNTREIRTAKLNAKVGLPKQQELDSSKSKKFDDTEKLKAIHKKKELRITKKEKANTYLRSKGIISPTHFSRSNVKSNKKGVFTAPKVVEHIPSLTLITNKSTDNLIGDDITVHHIQRTMSNLKSYSTTAHLYKENILENQMFYKNKSVANFNAYSKHARSKAEGDVGTLAKLKPGMHPNLPRFSIETFPQIPNTVRNVKNIISPTSVHGRDYYTKTIQQKINFNRSPVVTTRDKVKKSTSKNLKTFGTASKNMMSEEGNITISVQKSVAGFNRTVTISQQQTPDTKKNVTVIKTVKKSEVICSVKRIASKSKVKKIKNSKVQKSKFNLKSCSALIDPSIKTIKSNKRTIGLAIDEEKINTECNVKPAVTSQQKAGANKNFGSITAISKLNIDITPKHLDSQETDTKYKKSISAGTQVQKDFNTNTALLKRNIKKNAKELTNANLGQQSNTALKLNSKTTEVGKVRPNRDLKKSIPLVAQRIGVCLGMKSGLRTTVKSTVNVLRDNLVLKTMERKEQTNVKKNKTAQNRKFKKTQTELSKWDLTRKVENPKWKELVGYSKKIKISPSLRNILCDGGIKIKTHLNTQRVISDYLTIHRSIIVNLIRTIDEIKSLPVFSSAVRCLYQIVVSSQLLDGGEIFNIMDYMKAFNFTVLLKSMSTIIQRFAQDSKFKPMSVDLYTKLFKIINGFCKARQCQNQLKKINRETLQCLCYILRQQLGKEMVVNLLDIFKLICSKRRNCRFLSYKEFYDSLYVSYKLTQKLFAVINILKLMAKGKSTLKHMCQHEKIINILLKFINHHSKTSYSRCAVIDILYKIANNEQGLLILFKRDNYSKLYNYFTKCKEKEECQCRMKIYSILNRFKNTIVLTNRKLDMDFHLPKSLLQCLECERSERKEDTESEDSDESSDEEDSDDSCSSHELTNKNNEKVRIIDINLSNMQKYFLEYFSAASKTADSCKFRMFEYKGIPIDKHNIQRRVIRRANLGGLAFPDAAMLSAESDKHTISSSEFPLEYLTQKLRIIHNSAKPSFTPKTVYDLDDLYIVSDQVVLPQPNSYVPGHRAQLKGNGLCFESRFECGNLRKATRVDEYEYDLTLSPDTLTSKGLQWFYFQVSNMFSGIAYTFNIINFTRDTNMYNEGMLPVVFSATNYKLNGIGWRRAGGKVVFYGNHYTNETGTLQYRTMTFSIVFPFMCDHIYIAYHFPYTYTRLMASLLPTVDNRSNRIYVRLDKLCNTVNNANEVPLLTITAALHHPESLHIPLRKRPVIFLTARVHPGESNASWVMEGIIRYLLHEMNTLAATAREYFVFKIIPMLNPEGVIYGNTRCGLTGRDLNRCWAKPSEILCPEIYYSKRLIEYAKGQSGIPIAAYIDIHGHSQKKFFFLYGCNPKLSWKSKDRQRGDKHDIFEVIPKAIQALNPNIELSECKNNITKSREKTGRVVMWRELGIVQSYTLECSYSEASKKQSMSTKLLTEVGESVVAALGKIADKLYKFKQAMPSFSLDYTSVENWKPRRPKHKKPSADVPRPSVSTSPDYSSSQQH